MRTWSILTPQATSLSDDGFDRRHSRQGGWRPCVRGGVHRLVGVRVCRRERAAARAIAASGDDLLADVAFAATAGHVLDFDDTFSDGVAHVSAATAPAALVLAAHLGLSIGATLAAYAEGFEAMAAIAAASHPGLYDAGWHPTAVCGPVGAAVAASSLLELTPAQREHAIALALLRAGGTRGAFGSDGKAIQVGLAAAAGVQAALLARAGAMVDPRAIHGPLGFVAVLGASWPTAGVGGTSFAGGSRAIERNWIKLYPSCLGTHSPIEAARCTRERPPADHEQHEVCVHPVARQAAHLDTVDDGLAAKFSIPYCVAHTLAYGPPGVRDFTAIDPAARDGLAAREGARRSIAARVRGDPDVGRGRGWRARTVRRASPERPVAPSELAAEDRRSRRRSPGWRARRS